MHSFLFNLHKTESREGRNADSSSERGTSRSRSPRRSLSPFRRSKKRDSSAEGLRKDSGNESEPESDSAPVVVPSNSFDDESEFDSDEGELEYGEEDEEMERNTEVSRPSTSGRVLSVGSVLGELSEGRAAFMCDSYRSPATISLALGPCDESADLCLLSGSSTHPSGHHTSF